MIHVRRLRLRGLIAHEDTSLQFPPRGVVLITGPNRAGKSSCIDAVAVALWGKTLRGTEPWRPNAEEAFVELETPELLVRRKRRGAPSWRFMGEAAAAHPTKTKAQADLRQLVGDLDLWRKTSVFRSEDAGVFTRATDGERKRLIEALLRLERYDAGLKACRTDLQAVERELDHQRTELRVGRERQDGLLRSIQDLEAMRRPIPAEAPGQNPDELKTLIARLTELGRGADQDLQDVRAQVRLMTRSIADVKQRLAVSERELQRLDRDACPSCGQSIPEHLRNQAKADVDRTANEVTAELQGVEADLTRQIDLEAELSTERDALQAKLAQARADLRMAEERARLRVRLEQEQANLETGIAQRRQEAETNGAKLAELGQQVVVAQQRVAELEAVERVLGLEGVRVQLLGRALSAIEGMANGWLAKLGWDGLAISLKPYAETGAGVRDRISFELHGAGAGFGYQAASAGEKRRVDSAIMFALADFVAAAHGTAPGTIFADEIADSLDTDGIGRMATVLRELAQDRVVVVVSHNQELQSVLGPDLHLRIADGKLQRT